MSTGLEGRQRFIDRHADVRSREGIGRRGEDGQCIGAGGLGPGHAALVRDEDGKAHAGRVRGRGMSSSASASCGMALGDDEAGRLDLAEAGGASAR